MKRNDSHDQFEDGLQFAASAHGDELIPGSQIPYLAHVFLVALEILNQLEEFHDEEPDLLLQSALLHDVLEDTKTTRMELREKFGKEVELVVFLLSKKILSEESEDKSLDDYLAGLTNGPRSAQIIKMADRIVNLRPPPPDWTKSKICEYLEEAIEIHRRLGTANQAMADRLEKKLVQYQERYVESAHC